MRLTTSTSIAVSDNLPVAVLAAALDTSEAAIAIVSTPDLGLVFANATFRSLGASQDCAAIATAIDDAVQSGHTARIARFDAMLTDEPDAIWEGEVSRAGSDTQGNPLLLLCIRNVTHTVRAERALAFSEDALQRTNAKLRDTLDSITDGVLMMDHDWRYTFVSARAAAIVGIPADKLVGGIVWELFPAAPGSQFYDGYHQAAATGLPVHFEEYFPAPLNMWLECHCYPTPDGLTVYFRNVTARRLGDLALRENTAILSAISDTSADVMFAKDRAGRMRFANPATLALIGRPLNDVLGKTDADLLGDQAAAAAVMHNDRMVMDSGQAAEYEEMVPMPDGTHKVWLSRKIPYLDEHGTVIGLLGVSREITERARKEQDMAVASTRKDEFLAMLAHELRNPLAPIMNGAQMLDKVAGDEGRVRNISRIITRQAAHMVTLVDDLLDVSRLQRGLVELHKENLDINSVMQHALEQVRGLVDTRRHTLALHPAPMRATVLGDFTRLTQALTNILVNAAKFTPEGGHITLRAVDAGAGFLKIDVTDNGIGIEPPLLGQVFGLFTQGERSLDRTMGGLGLGLPLVKSIVGMHGGSVSVRSDGLGQGSTFTIMLPLLATRAAPLQADQQPPPTRAPQRSGILIVDDNADAADSLADWLSSTGHPAASVHDVAGAMALATSTLPGTLILDIGLPGMDGYELARWMRRQPGLENATLIALSGYGQQADRALGIEAGFDHYLVKPADLAQLETILNAR
ncbi:MAG: PAS domain-containing protein [Pseudomonadota bacterium]|nr:PAS domain-containing protein [Pseudomonadota bacterium]